MNWLLINWTTFNPVQGDGFIDVFADNFDTTALLGILAGVVGITIGFTLIWRFAAYIRNTITGGMTNSKKRRK